MSLHQRLAKMDARIKALEEVVGDVARDQLELANAISAGEEDEAGEPERSLDGEVLGGERDQSQSLG